MGTLYGPKIVTDGLVLYLDVGNTKSYSPNTLTLYDLKNYSDASLLSSISYDSSYGGSVLVGDTIRSIRLSSDVSLGTNWTIEVGTKYRNDNKFYEFFLGKFETGTAIGRILLRIDGYIGYSYPAFTYYSFSTTSDSITGVNKVLTFTSDSSVLKLYVNGVWNTGDIISLPNAPFILSEIGNAWGDYSWMAPSRVYFLRAYNRALTLVEIQQNYNATKGRFGL